MSRTDVGEVCLSLDGDRLVVEVVLESWASSCIQELDTSCHVWMEGEAISVTAQGTWLPPEAESCDDACLPVVATCEVEAPPVGLYSISYGEVLTGVDLGDLPACAGSL